ncbi:hypothetical protein PENDEC_c039G01429 [Penicillium decumbens]|uniref:DNA-directed RNA polymerase II subunit RPB9 n=1 Tax=Penicillium decumbens TaxID=69771 RepID=A0A1V6NRF7_PENDC|nr:hypothetical protein PENDEC_c039G01429 [Penicillium decumbens]
MSASPSPSAGTETKQSDQIHFRFCRECSNLLYPKEDRHTNQLMFTCRTCHVGEPATSHCVYQNKLNSQVGATAGVTQDVSSDPTVCGPDDICALGFVPGFCFCCGQEIVCSVCGQLPFTSSRVLEATCDKPCPGEDDDTPNSTALPNNRDTLPRANKLCPSCGENEAVFFQSQQRSAETGMKLYYVCCACGNVFM